jgi:hypothetical protein
MQNLKNKGKKKTNKQTKNQKKNNNTTQKTPKKNLSALNYKRMVMSKYCPESLPETKV